MAFERKMAFTQRANELEHHLEAKSLGPFEDKTIERKRTVDLLARTAVDDFIDMSGN